MYVFTFFFFSFINIAILQKALAQLRTLNLSATLSGNDKEKSQPVLKADFM